jgi:hypothetical protein
MEEHICPEDDAQVHVAVSSEFKAAVDGFIAEHKVVAFIKGDKMFPQCDVHASLA